jgi:hypothetical protein
MLHLRGPINKDRTPSLGDRSFAPLWTPCRLCAAIDALPTLPHEKGRLAGNERGWEKKRQQVSRSQIMEK